MHVNYKLMVEYAPEGIVVTHQNGEGLYWNHRAGDMLGFEKSDITRLSVQEMVLAEDQKFNPLKFEELKAGKTTVVERRIRHMNGGFIPAELTTRMLPDGNLMCIMRNISERKFDEINLRENEEMFRGFFMTSPAGMIISEVFGRVARANPAFCRLTGYSEEELYSLTISDFTHNADKQAEVEIREWLVAGGAPSMQMEKQYVRKDGSHVKISAHYSMMRGVDERPMYIFVTAVPMTD